MAQGCAHGGSTSTIAVHPQTVGPEELCRRKRTVVSVSVTLTQVVFPASGSVPQDTPAKLAAG